MAPAVVAISGWEKALMAAERVKERLRRATRALDEAGVAYAVVGRNAVAEWVARIDEGAVRNTRDVDILVRRSDFDSVRTVLEGAGFIHHRILDLDTFIDGATGRPSEGVHILYSGEKVSSGDQHALPDVGDFERGLANLSGVLKSFEGVGLPSTSSTSRFGGAIPATSGLRRCRCPNACPSL